MITRLFNLSCFIFVYWRKSSGVLVIWLILNLLNIILKIIDPENSNYAYLYLKCFFYLCPIYFFGILYFSDKNLMTNNFYSVFRILKTEVALSKLIVLYWLSMLSSLIFLFSIGESGNSGKFLILLNTFFATVSILIIIKNKWLKGVVFILGIALGNGLLSQIPEKFALICSTIVFLSFIRIIFEKGYVDKI